MSRSSQRVEHTHGKAISADGDRAYIPLALLRAPLWPITASNAKKLEDGETYIRRLTNAYGDRIAIQSNAILRPKPDMGVLLTLTAMFQKRISGNPAYDTGLPENEERIYYDFSCQITELMRETGIRHESRLTESLKRLGSVRLKFQRQKSGADYGETFFEIDGMFTFRIERVGGGEKAIRTHKGDRLVINMHRAFIPKTDYLYRSAKQCRALRTDTARLIFWALCSRLHFKGTAEEWYTILSPDTKTYCGKMQEQARQKLQWQWENKSFKPALLELAKAGFCESVNRIL
ncbi:hypothetical protein [uncultured Cloacibacillus sp.]|uniref:hypothetical protein n=1 Tax=uncultured Cloacibacillus sp. TaxID=889794 RepID=UPI003207FA23